MRRYPKSGERAAVAGLSDERMHVPVDTVAIILTPIVIFAFLAVLLHPV
jgi:hypothetical protein